MSRPPAHRRRRDPFARTQLAPRVAPRTHPFAAGGERDWRDQPSCAECGLPKDNRVHTMPDNPAAEEEARRYGDREEGEQ